MSEKTQNTKTSANSILVIGAFIIFIGTMVYMNSTAEVVKPEIDYKTILFEENKKLQHSTLDLEIQKIQIQKIELDQKTLEPVEEPKEVLADPKIEELEKKN